MPTRKENRDPAVPPGPAAAGTARLSLGVWVVQAACFVASAVMLALLVVVACFFDPDLHALYSSPHPPEEGSAENDTRVTSDVRGGVTSSMQPDAHGVVGTLVITACALLAAAVYVAAGGLTARRATGGDPEGRLAATYLVASQAALFAGSSAAWLLQVAVVLLARHAVLTGYVVYALHCFCLAAFGGLFCTRGVLSGTYARQTRALRDAAPEHHRLVGPGRAVVSNLILAAVGLSTAMAAVAAETVACVTFASTVAGVIVWAAAVFSGLVVAALLCTELVLANYVQVLLGPHLGLIIACGIVGVALETYYARNYYVAQAQLAGARTGVRLALALLAALVMLMAVVRAVRAVLHHRRRDSGFAARVRATRDRARRQLGRVRSSVREAGRRLNGSRRARPESEHVYAEIPYAEVSAGESGDDEEHIYEVPDDKVDVFLRPPSARARAW
ncbi:envelope glycoprotein M [Ateline alphaherpesvirus 1]|uniref:Envelope glycoprotein M n=1 Tax=Herpesvirus ateles type 1 (strain Lennette) TaxID=35243 RepID=A0A1S6JLQ7_HSVA1|nr:envelope glycoprotein M [Ateline alphaherpesvirus 1]AQS79206.1 envelope glycoprotein M [Ateline alphaherpesvirus 1]